MESYKQVEHSKAFEETNTSPFKQMATEYFDKEWAEHVKHMAQEKGIVIASLP